MRSDWQQAGVRGAVLATVLATTACAQGPPADRSAAGDLSASVDALFTPWDNADAPGAAVAVIRGGRIVYQNAYGMADLERDVPLDTTSVFEIGSISKQFTAMCVLLLARDGVLSIDDDVRRWIPEMPDYGEPITIRHLLHHTSGIRDIETLFPLAGLPYVNYYSASEQIALLARQKALNFRPGSAYLYSNSGYVLLANIVERASGEPLRAFAEKRIFAPLGMTSTVFWDHPGQIVRNRALAYSRDGAGGWREEVWNLPFTGPADLYTTVGDLARWDANFYDNRLGGGAELIELMETSGVLDDGQVTGYAMGLAVGSLFGLPVVRHSGAWQGYRAGMMRFSEQRLSVVLLSNAAQIDVGSGDVALLYLADEIQTEDAAVEVYTPPSGIDLGVRALESFSGTYWNGEAGLLRTIEVRDGNLWYVRGGGNDTELAATAPDRFVMVGPQTKVEVVFAPASETGGATMSVIEGGDALVLGRVPATDPGALASLAGEYWSDELRRALRLQVSDGGLTAAWTDEPEPTPALPIGDDDYVVPGFVPVPWSPQDVRLVIERGPDGSVAGLTLSCEMVRGISFARR